MCLFPYNRSGPFCVQWIREAFAVMYIYGHVCIYICGHVCMYAVMYVYIQAYIHTMRFVNNYLSIYFRNPFCVGLFIIWWREVIANFVFSFILKVHYLELLFYKSILYRLVF